MGGIHLRKLSIRGKLFLTLTLCVNLIIGLLSYLYYRQMSSVVWDRNEEATRQTQLRLGSAVDRIYKDIDRISAQIVYDPELSAYFNAPVDDGSYETFVRLRKLTTLLQTFNGPALTAKRIIVFNLNGQYIHYGLNWDTYPNLSDQFDKMTWIASTILKKGDRMLVPPRPTEWQTTGEIVFSLTRLMNPNTLIEVQQPYSLLEQTMTEGITPSSGASIFIYDDAGHIFYPYGLTKIPFDTDGGILASNGSEVVRSDTGDTNIINLTHSSYTGLNIALLQPKSELLKPIRKLQTLTLGIIGAAELLALLLSYWIARTITSPIIKLQRFVRKVDLAYEPNAQTPTIEYNHSQELNELYDTFMKMTVGLRRSMNRILDLQHRENVAQMQALYAQMNPHFLYNTLTSIARRAEEAGETLVARMCYKLTSMMRYSTAAIAMPATAGDEFTNAVAYLDLMKLRYEDQFQYEAELQPDLSGMSVPRLILQPLLENCFAHGLRKVEPPWRIQLSVMPSDSADGAWYIRIADNGGGFEAAGLVRVREMMAALNDGHAASELQTITSRGLGNIGLENTLTRCRKFWEDHVRFAVDNLPEGAEIVIRVSPQPKKEESACSESSS